jgi:hypothetical protein
MTLEIERAPVFLPGVWRKLTYTLIMVVLIPLSTITMMLLLILIAINPRAWRQPTHRVRGGRLDDDGGSDAF